MKKIKIKHKSLSLYEKTRAAKPMFKSHNEAIAFYKGLSNQLQKEIDFALHQYKALGLRKKDK